MRFNHKKSYHCSINSLDSLNAINNTNKAKVPKIFKLSFWSLCLVATLVSITQVLPHSSLVFAEGNNTVSASSSVTASVTVSSACSFSRTNGSGDYTGVLANNNSVEVPGSTFTTLCNDPGGYAVYAIGYSNNTLGNTDLIFNNIADSTNNIKTNGDTLAGSNGSYWKMKLSPVSGDFTPTIENSYSNYNNIPSNYTKVTSFNNVTVNGSDSTTGSSITTSYQAYASSTQPAGTYTGAVKYTMVHPSLVTSPSTCPTNSICYSPNSDGNGVVNGSMGIQAIASDATSATLLASNFWRSGYGFAGWNTEYDGSGTFYGPNEDIEFTAGQYGGTNGGLSLYAIWVKSTGYLQDWNGCPALTQTIYNSETGKLEANLSSITALTDKRDNQTYAVARLADGNCWMIENLRLESEYTRGNNINDPSVTNESLSQGYGGVFHGLADPETSNFSNSTTPNSLYGIEGSGKSNIIDATSHTADGIDYTGYYFPRYRNTNTTSPAINPTNANANIYSYGNYYTWTAAMANTTFYDSYSGVNDSDTANTSICPKGWKLPKGNNQNNSNSFYYLNQRMGKYTDASGSKKFRSFPNNFLYSGLVIENDSIKDRGFNSLSWSSSARTPNSAFNIYLYPPRLYPGTDSSNKFRGFTIRCIAE